MGSRNLDDLVFDKLENEIADLRGQLARLQEENARLIEMAKERAIRVDGRVELPPGCTIGFLIIETGGTPGPSVRHLQERLPNVEVSYRWDNVGAFNERIYPESAMRAAISRYEARGMQANRIRLDHDPPSVGST